MSEFARRAEDIRNGNVKHWEDNMLKVTNEARQLGLDPRLLDANTENNPASKMNKCIENIYDEYINLNNFKGTQIIFCEIGTPTGTNIQSKLVALHHLDVPWRPSDIEQRNERILRQGNKNEEEDNNS